jgi:hypothetical protein
MPGNSGDLRLIVVDETTNARMVMDGSVRPRIDTINVLASRLGVGL